MHHIPRLVPKSVDKKNEAAQVKGQPLRAPGSNPKEEEGNRRTPDV